MLERIAVLRIGAALLAAALCARAADAASSKSVEASRTHVLGADGDPESAMHRSVCVAR